MIFFVLFGSLQFFGRGLAMLSYIRYLNINFNRLNMPYISSTTIYICSKVNTGSYIQSRGYIYI